MTKTVIVAALGGVLLATALFGFILLTRSTPSQTVYVVPLSSGRDTASVAKPAATPHQPGPHAAAQAQQALSPVTLINDKISIQSAVQEICYQAGLNYQWRRSHDATEPDCRRYVRVDLNRANLMSALDSIVKSNGLAYHIDGKDVWLERPE